MKLTLPATINAPKFRKDGSVSISFDSRELLPEEIMLILGARNTEGWLLFAPSELKEEDIPLEPPEIEQKSPVQRLLAVLYVWYRQEVERGKFVGLFDTFRKERLERIIEGVKSKLD